jgi:hypothetical protein
MRADIEHVSGLKYSSGQALGLCVCYCRLYDDRLVIHAFKHHL